MLKIKITTQHPDWPLIRQTVKSLGVLDECHFFVNQEIKQCDYWFVFDGLLKQEETVCSPKNVVLVTWEPPSIKSYNQKFIDQFNLVVTCHKNINHKNVIYSQQAHPWFVDRNYDQLKEPLHVNKSKILSVITSDKIFTEGHKKRYDFVMKLKNHFGDLIDVYGRGVKDFDDKWDVLAPYKYSIAIENLAYEDWLTEKLPDCFLAETFPFYYGCPNITHYFEPDSYKTIDIEDFEKSVKIIEETILDESHFALSHPKILNAKQKYIDEISFFPFVKSIIYQMRGKSRVSAYSLPKMVTLYPEDMINANSGMSKSNSTSFRSKIKNKFKKMLGK